MAARGSWTHVPIDDARALIYGPRLGRLYVVTRVQAFDRPLQQILGLGRFDFAEAIDDPALMIVHDLGTMKAVPPLEVPASLRLGYRMLHLSRHFVPFNVIVALVCKAAATLGRRTDARKAASPWSVSDFGRLLHGIERRVGIADCYPRALMTCFLALRHGHRCALTIGALSPTRKMHAWCSIDGRLPYEAMPEHYMYRPLLVMSLEP